MAYKSYVTSEEYKEEYDTIPEEELGKWLKRASRDIDSLTFNRIPGNGWYNLTVFQQEIVKECVCELSNFEYENEDMIDSMMQSYSLNGASIQFGETWNMYVKSGVAIPKSIYARLEQTGLTSPIIRN